MRIAVRTGKLYEGTAAAPRENVTVVVDGGRIARIASNETLRVRRGKNPVVLVRSSHSYFEIWRNKLRWG